MGVCAAELSEDAGQEAAGTGAGEEEGGSETVVVPEDIMLRPEQSGVATVAGGLVVVPGRLQFACLHPGRASSDHSWLLVQQLSWGRWVWTSSQRVRR